MSKVSDIIKGKVTDFLKKYGLLDENNRLLAAFSGGPDSLCLLDVLYNVNKSHNFKLAAAHLNHNWRGEESRQEAEKAKNYCKERQIDFYTETLPAELPQTEEEARNRRYEFFNKISAKIGATAILTGHTRTDQAETVLYRIIKGTGTAGLGGIPEIRDQTGSCAIYRPLLADISRCDCIKYCEDNNLAPSFDPGNYDQKYLRNRIRHGLLPELRTYNSAIDDALIRLSLIAKESEDIIEEYTAQTGKNIFKNVNSICTKEFLKLSNPLKKRILLDFLRKNEIEYTFERIADLFFFIEENPGSKSGKTFSIGKDLWFFASSKEMKIIEKTRAISSYKVVLVSFESETTHSGLNVSLNIEKWQQGKPDKFPSEDEYVVFADLSGIKGEIYLRTRIPGDIIRPFGMKETTKLKKYLINRAIPKHIRDEIPLLADENEVLWAAGVGISEKLRVKEIPTHKITIKRINLQ